MVSPLLLLLSAFLLGSSTFLVDVLVYGLQSGHIRELRDEAPTVGSSIAQLDDPVLELALDHTCNHS